MHCKGVADGTSPRKTVAELEQELAEAERFASSLREQLEQAKWIQEYNESQV